MLPSAPRPVFLRPTSIAKLYAYHAQSTSSCLIIADPIDHDTKASVDGRGEEGRGERGRGGKVISPPPLSHPSLPPPFLACQFGRPHRLILTMDCALGSDLLLRRRYVLSNSHEGGLEAKLLTHPPSHGEVGNGSRGESRIE